MREQPNLSEAEWSLVAELLRQELDQLPAEIHHTRVADYRHHLHDRRKMVQLLLERLSGVAAA